MSSKAIYSRTAKGTAELRHRRLPLSRADWRILEMVDGKLSAGELLSRLRVAPEALAAGLHRLTRDGLLIALPTHSDEDLPYDPRRPTITVDELDPEEGVRAWADARRCARSLRGSGYFTHNVRPLPDGKVPEILVVEDDPAVAKLVGSVLQQEGFAVRHAPDGKEALAALSSQMPDLAILDLMLPDTTGFALLDWIRHQSSRVDLPVVILTARVGEDDVMQGLRGGADGYIFKPFQIKPFIQCVRSVLQI